MLRSIRMFDCLHFLTFILHVVVLFTLDFFPSCLINVHVFIVSVLCIYVGQLSTAVKFIISIVVLLKYMYLNLVKLAYNHKYRFKG